MTVVDAGVCAMGQMRSRRCLMQFPSWMRLFAVGWLCLAYSPTMALGNNVALSINEEGLNQLMGLVCLVMFQQSDDVENATPKSAMNDLLQSILPQLSPDNSLWRKVGSPALHLSSQVVPIQPPTRTSVKLADSLAIIKIHDAIVDFHILSRVADLTTRLNIDEVVMELTPLYADADSMVVSSVKVELTKLNLGFQRTYHGLGEGAVNPLLRSLEFTNSAITLAMKTLLKFTPGFLSDFVFRRAGQIAMTLADESVTRLLGVQLDLSHNLIINDIEVTISERRLWFSTLVQVDFPMLRDTSDQGEEEPLACVGSVTEPDCQPAVQQRTWGNAWSRMTLAVKNGWQHVKTSARRVASASAAYFRRMSKWFGKSATSGRVVYIDGHPGMMRTRESNLNIAYRYSSADSAYNSRSGEEERALASDDTRRLYKKNLIPGAEHPFNTKELDNAITAAEALFSDVQDPFIIYYK